MNKRHNETRRKLKEIASVKEFESVLDRCTMTEDERQMMILHYIQGKDFRFIGDTLGFSESSIKRKHRKVLAKISVIL